MAVASLVLIFASLLACDRLRHFVSSSLKDNLLLRDFLMDVVITVEAITVSLELGVIIEHYGIRFWLVGLFSFCVYQSVRWQGLSPPIPYLHLLDYVSGRQSLSKAMARSAVVLAAGLCTYRFLMAPLWSLELTADHAGRALATSPSNCVVAFKSTPALTAFATEALGTLALTVGPNLVVDSPTLQNNEPLITSALISGMVAFVVYMAMDISGGMFSPVLASVLLGGCQGHTMTQHVVIYWVGATLGALGGAMVYPTIKRVIYPTPATKTNDPDTKKKKN